MKLFRINLLEKQRDLIADKLMDSANYALAGLVFNALYKKQITIIVLLGSIMYILGWLISIKMKK